MGIIKDGTISGNLPANTAAFAVNYPAYPSSIARAVETLGGTEAIAKARSSESNKLELHFRPEDPYSHPAFGELHTCNNFLLRISKDRVSNAQDPELRKRVSSSSSADPVSLEQHESCSGSIETTAEAESQVVEERQEHLSADIVACIGEAYHFNGMVDYQHVIAVHADIAKRKKRNWAEFVEKGGLMDVDQDDLMILVPPLFSLKDRPEKIVLKPCIHSSSKTKQEDMNQHHQERNMEPSLALDIDIEEIPKKVNWEKFIPEGSEQWVLQNTVAELFNERPIWVKDSLSEHLLDKGLEFGENMLKRLLFRAAYYFSTGPFRRFWIRKGYDPRKDPESRIYQTMDFRVPVPLRSYCEANSASSLQEKRRHERVALPFTIMRRSYQLKHRWEDICAFRAFPYKCQTSLQLFELADDYIQEEIRKPSNVEAFSKATGWFSANVLETLRHRVAVRFLSVYPNAGAEAILKSECDLFEKSKKMRLYPKNLKANEERQQDNRGHINFYIYATFSRRESSQGFGVKRSGRVKRI
nr:general transcription factor 3C polypeptide 5-like [Coffea arabica]